MRGILPQADVTSSQNLHPDLCEARIITKFTMEEDREATNLTSAPVELEGEENVQSKQPKRRFVGRRAAAAAAGESSKPSNGNIEDSGAIQGKSQRPNNYKKFLLIIRPFL